MLAIRPNTVHYTQLAPAQPDSPNATEWETYRQHVGCLLGDGHEGKTVLIKGRTIIGLFDSWEQAANEGHQRFGMTPYLIHRVQTWEPLLYLRR